MKLRKGFVLDWQRSGVSSNTNECSGDMELLFHASVPLMNFWEYEIFFHDPRIDRPHSQEHPYLNVTVFNSATEEERNVCEIPCHKRTGPSMREYYTAMLLAEDDFPESFPLIALALLKEQQ